MARSRVAILLLGIPALVLLLAGGGHSSPGVPDIYVNNRRFSGVVCQGSGDLQVGLEAMSALLKLRVTREEGTGRFLVGERALQSVRALRTARGDVAVVNLSEITACAGARVLRPAGTGMIDIITYNPTDRARVVAERKDAPRTPARAPGDPRRTADAACLEEIYGLCIHHLRTQLNMEIKLPVVKYFVPLQEIQSRAHSKSVRGFTTTRYNAQLGRTEVLLFIPTGETYQHATHVMAHELGHAWQMDSNVQFGTLALTEGFCEWVASEVLRASGLDEELAVIEGNLFWEYSDGYQYVKRMAAKVGAQGVVQYFRDSSYSKGRE